MDSSLSIAIIEDHDALREATVSALSMHGHKVIGLECAEALYEQTATDHLDILIVDLNLPGENGISLTKRIRQAQPNLGIIILSADSDLAQKKAGYEGGADIYLTKPTALEELNAAILALARRLKSMHTDHANAIRLYVRSMCAKGSEAEAPLNANEVSLLVALARSPDNRLETWQLLELIGFEPTDASKANLEVQIVRLRKKLHQIVATEHPIRSIRSFGYQLCIPIQVLDQ